MNIKGKRKGGGRRNKLFLPFLCNLGDFPLRKAWRNYLPSKRTARLTCDLISATSDDIHSAHMTNPHLPIQNIRSRPIKEHS